MAAAKMARQSLVTQKSRLCKIVIAKNQTVMARAFFCAIVPDIVCREEDQYKIQESLFINTKVLLESIFYRTRLQMMTTISICTPMPATSDFIYLINTKIHKLICSYQQIIFYPELHIAKC
ncbi:hypothetical protein [Niastella populi]|uniref:Uncharacterized protein n=1 Tax=Niastella populi TaxID=550983 RepID=A0A1V9EHT3_9BACT|nr:hypothetical protein [Niastella populi]OQP45698.1 hypothetical protein A4R26_09385 [Niastella populi]